MVASTAIRFGCTMCGGCCHNLNLPLTLDETVGWVESGGRVDIYCEADVWTEPLAGEDGRRAHRERRSFATRSGTLPVRVTVIFAGAVEGACHNLRADFKCGAYERRPLVCRIYPAEINPFIQLDPAQKICPPEAWASGDLIALGGKPASTQVQQWIEQSRQTDQNDAPYKSLVCKELGINVTAIHGQGFVRYRPDARQLVEAIQSARKQDALGFHSEWSVCVPRTDAGEALKSQGAAVTANIATPQYLYLRA